MKDEHALAPQSLGSGQMFDGIAQRYDLLNKLMSFGLDRLWRRRLVRSLGQLQPGDRILDVATGTADVALALAHHHHGTHVTGLDPSAGMLACGDEKVKARGLDKRIRLIVGDAQDMPFDDAHFSGATIAFGIRNVPDRLKGLKEMHRVCKTGAKVSVLELSEPETGLLAPFARFHVHHLVPFVGGLLSGRQEYRYLQESIAAFPNPETFAGLMGEAGFKDVKIHRQTFGSCHLYVGTRS